jgi:hypothetical protein
VKADDSNHFSQTKKRKEKKKKGKKRLPHSFIRRAVKH